jgi:hypothetical protein
MEIDEVPLLTQRHVDAMALFEELSKIEKERLKTTRKLMKKDRKEGIGNKLTSSELSSQKEIEAFALFEELQKAEVNRMKAKKHGKEIEEPTIVIEEKPEIIPTTQKEMEAFALFEELQKVEANRKNELIKQIDSAKSSENSTDGMRDLIYFPIVLFTH